jgi:uncharacterized protein YbjT (DUF2867 family)
MSTTSPDPAAPMLVVGATGYLGSQVVDELSARGKNVRALVRPSTDVTERLGAPSLHSGPAP